MNDSSANNRRQGIVRAQRVVDDVEVIARGSVSVRQGSTQQYVCLFEVEIGTGRYYSLSPPSINSLNEIFISNIKLPLIHSLQ